MEKGVKQFLLTLVVFLGFVLFLDSLEYPVGYASVSGREGSCEDTDSGNDPINYGWVEGVIGSFEYFDPNNPPIAYKWGDECLSDNEVREYLCKDHGGFTYDVARCPSGMKCVAGGCENPDEGLSYQYPGVVVQPEEPDEVEKLPDIVIAPEDLYELEELPEQSISQGSGVSVPGTSSQGSNVIVPPTNSPDQTSGVIVPPASTSQGSVTVPPTSSSGDSSSSVQTSPGTSTSDNQDTADSGSKVIVPPTSDEEHLTVTPEYLCVDSDKNEEEKARYKKGRVDLINPNDGKVLKSFEDYCISPKNVLEYYCEKNKVKNEELECSKGCYDGACSLGGSTVETIQEQDTEESVITTTTTKIIERDPCKEGKELSYKHKGQTAISLGNDEVGVDFVGNNAYIQFPDGKYIEVITDTNLAETIKNAVEGGVETPLAQTNIHAEVNHYEKSSGEPGSSGRSSYSEGVSLTLAEEGNSLIMYLGSSGTEIEDRKYGERGSEAITMTIHGNGKIAMTVHNFWTGEIYNFYFDHCGNILLDSTKVIKDSYEEVVIEYEGIQIYYNQLLEIKKGYESEVANNPNTAEVQSKYDRKRRDLFGKAGELFLEFKLKCMQIQKKLNAKEEGLAFYQKWFNKELKDLRNRWNAGCSTYMNEMEPNFDFDMKTSQKEK